MRRPLYVDLDRTLVRTDIFCEQAAQLLYRRPARFLVFLVRLLSGRAAAKSWLSAQIELPLETLPLNEDVRAMAQAHHEAGSPVYLATATHESVAERFVKQFTFFSGVLATNDNTNLKGTAKLEAIRSHCREHGFDSFCYIGDSTADIPIWREAGMGWVVPGHAQKAALKAVAGLRQLGGSGKNYLASLVSALRVKQWSKNALLFLPLLLAHRLSEWPLVFSSFLGVIAFSLTASAIYIMNDSADVCSDRVHPRKRYRPFAAGDLPLLHAPMLCGALITGAVIVGWFGPGPAFLAILGFYFAANVLYTSWLKRLPIVDAVTLALMYALRIFAGGIAANVEVSKWLLIFSLFFFLSLAFGKRYQEAFRNNASLKTRGYLPEDLPILATSGLSCGFISVMVLALYLYSPEVQKLYRTPVLLWLLSPLLICWVGRFWLLTCRGRLDDDPVVFALNDRASWAIGLLMLGLLAAACFYR